MAININELAEEYQIGLAVDRRKGDKRRAQEQARAVQLLNQWVTPTLRERLDLGMAHPLDEDRRVLPAAAFVEGMVDLNGTPCILRFVAEHNGSTVSGSLRADSDDAHLMGHVVAHRFNTHEDEVLILAGVGEMAWQLRFKLEAAAWDRAERKAQQERRLRGAAVVRQLAREYAGIANSYEIAAREWATEWTDQLWHPWSAWQVRYVPVGYHGPVDEEGSILEIATVLEDVAEVVAMSPGASVRVVQAGGQLREMIMGAFLDATPLDFNEPTIERELAYHRSKRVWLANGRPIIVNIPPMVAREPDAGPHVISWTEYAAQCTGFEAFESAMRSWSWQELLNVSDEQALGMVSLEPLADVVL